MTDYSPAMPTPIHAAARRLTGHLVATPVIGDLRLPGFEVPPFVRVKAECLQTAGSVWYRGHVHHLLQSLGRYKGLVLHGEPRVILAQALAGLIHRLPMVAVTAGLPAPIATLVVGSGCEVVVSSDAAAVAAEKASATGFRLAAGIEDPSVHAGVATLGLELADELPADVSRVVVTDASYAAAVSAGFDAAERECEVVTAPDGELIAGWRDAVAQGLRLVPDDRSVVALCQAVAQEQPTCVVLS